MGSRARAARECARRNLRTPVRRGWAWRRPGAVARRRRATPASSSFLRLATRARSRTAKLLLLAGTQSAQASASAALLAAAVGPACDNGIAVEAAAGGAAGRETSSAFRGVSLQGGRWRARICVAKREMTLGDFGSEAEAAAAYDAAYMRAFPRATRHLNFVDRGLNDGEEERGARAATRRAAFGLT